MSLCLLMLCACSSQAPTPITVVKRVPVLPPAGLMPRCPEPPFTGRTFGDAVAFIPVLQGALRRCQARIDTQTHWFIQQQEAQP
ncbi:Rz1-like lysis system protein LysC [Aeromonas enteropelogenes]|uniref:Rz1-like lysis system protein LysC n=3 Tax=Aeromonas enteropelogenes TaxID=29489 RepID=UPI003BA210C7